MLTGDAERWANTVSLRLFNKPLAALLVDFERAKGGMELETLAAMIELGKEIEAADAARAQGEEFEKANGGIPEETVASPIERGRKSEVADASRSQISRMTAFQKWVVGVLAFTAVAGLWVTRWAYYDQMISPSMTEKARVRIDRWTGTRQVFLCDVVLNKEAQEQVRSLQAQLARIVEAWPRPLGLAGLVSGMSEQQRRVRPCPECPINYDLAPQVASEFPFSQNAEVQQLLQRLDAIKAENRHCGWK